MNESPGAPKNDVTLPNDDVTPPKSSAGRWLPLVAVLALIALASLFVAYNATQDLADQTEPPEGSSTSVPGKAAAVPEGFTRHTDPEMGFSLNYPEGWEKLTPPDEDVRLLLAAGGQNSLLVRVIRLEQVVTAENVADVKSFTDSIVGESEVRVLQERAVTLGGLPGYYYLYTFTDGESGAQGLHAHYFLFQGRKMNALVFQALPAEEFTNLAATFDQVAESFRSTPEDPEAASSTTTSPPTTAAP